MIDLSYTAERIQTARRENGFTQGELAARLGVTAQAVSKWERALSMPDIDMLLDLSCTLGVAVEDLLVDSKKPSTGVSVYDVGKSALGGMSFNDHLIIVSFGLGLVPIFTKELVGGLSELRTEILRERGVLLPLFRVMDDLSLGENECVMCYGTQELWRAQMAERCGEEVTAEIKAALISRLPMFVNRHMVKLLVENLKEQLPFAVEGVVPERISLSQLRRLLAALVAEGASVRDLRRIIELVDDCIDDTQDINEMCRRIGIQNDKR